MLIKTWCKVKKVKANNILSTNVFFIYGECNCSGFQAVLLFGVTTVVRCRQCVCVVAGLVRILPRHKSHSVANYVTTTNCTRPVNQYWTGTPLMPSPAFNPRTLTVRYRPILLLRGSKFIYNIAIYSFYQNDITI